MNCVIFWFALCCWSKYRWCCSMFCSLDCLSLLLIKRHGLNHLWFGCWWTLFSLLLWLLLWSTRCYERNESMNSINESHFNSLSFVFTWILFLWRLCCCYYFLAIPTLWGLAVRDRGSGIIYFTDWNFLLISAHYFFLSIASAIGVYHWTSFRSHLFLNPLGSSNSFWSKYVQYFGNALQISYAFTGATALFITIVAYVTLEHNFYLWNVSAHFATSISFLVDGLINRMMIRGEHLVFNFLWIFVYIVFIWGLVGSRTRTNWPYFFLETKSSAVFVWYVILFVVNIVFFFIWKAYNHLIKSLVCWCVRVLRKDQQQHQQPANIEMVSR